MIKNAVVFKGSLENLVKAYNSLPKSKKDPKYWENQEIDPIRQFVKQHYVHEQNYRCCYCGIQIPSNHGRLWDIEHIVPKSTHPSFLFEPENLAISCIDCNTAKKDSKVLVKNSVTTYPRRSNAFLLVHPHYDERDEHIAVSLGRIYIPKTEKGEYTIYTCQLLRYSYKQLGWDAGLVDDEVMISTFEKMMGAEDKKTREIYVKDILLMCQVSYSRSLLSTTKSNSLSTSTSSKLQQ